MSTLSKWLQTPPKDSLEQQYQELANLLRTKEKALETTSHDLKVKTAAMQILEQKIMSSETTITSAQRELNARTEQVRSIEAELAARSNRVTALEAEADVARQRMNDLNLIISDQAEEVRGAQQARQAAEQAQEVLKEEIRVLREHINQLNEGLTDRNYLRAQVEKMESSQDRVHRLEVELSDREAAHRGTIQQLERALADRDQRIHAFDASAAAQLDELRGAQQACQAAEQTQGVLKEEIRVLREQIAQLNEGLADREHVRVRMEKLESAQDRVHKLEVELSDREAAHRGTLQQLEQSLAERDRRISEFDALAVAQADEVRDVLETCRVAEQTREVQKEEIRVLREQIAQLNEGLADRDRLRAQVAKLDSTQNHIHQLEVELSDREAAHRGTIQQLERALADRDQRIHAFDASAAAQLDELRGAQQACQAAEQTQGVLKEEIRVLREQIAQLNEGLPARERLRAEVQEHVKESESMRSRVHKLEVELSDREAAHRGTLQQLEQSLAERDRRISEFDALAVAQADEVRDVQQTCHAAEQAQEVLREEIRVLREHIAQLNEGLADRDHLRAQVAKLNSTQDRVHRLEVELSDREAAHRETMQQLEKSLVERDKRIEKLLPVTHLVREKESEIKEWENKFTRTIRDHEKQVTKLQEQCAVQDQVREQHRLAERHLHERDEQIVNLQRQLHDLETARRQLTTEVQRIPEKDEQISRLRKRLREMQSELRAEPTPSAKGVTVATANPVANAAPSAHPALSTKSAQPTVGLRQGRQNGAGNNSQVTQPKSGNGKDVQKDDLQKINGIGPVFAQILNKLGTYTFIQIARWKPEDIEKVSKRLETDPERIKRENWIADAKKQHYKKYGEKL
jgi:predicted flap endonuclease-1-like 5' DNA nuclease